MANIAKPFTDILGELQHGRFLEELSDRVTEIVAAVMDTRKTGELTIKLKFLPTGKGTVEVDADLKAKEPEHDRPSTTFFVDKSFQLLRRDPNQPQLPLREVDIGRGPPRAVDAAE